MAAKDGFDSTMRPSSATDGHADRRILHGAAETLFAFGDATPVEARLFDDQPAEQRQHHDDADGELEAEGKAAIRRIEAGKRAGHRQSDQRGADRAAGDRQVERRQEDGSDHQRNENQKEGKLRPLDGRQRQQRAGADDRCQPRQPSMDWPNRQAERATSSSGPGTGPQSPVLRRQPSARTTASAARPALAPQTPKTATAASAGAATPPSTNMIAIVAGAGDRRFPVAADLGNQRRARDDRGHIGQRIECAKPDIGSDHEVHRHRGDEHRQRARRQPCCPDFEAGSATAKALGSQSPATPFSNCSSRIETAANAT